MCFKDIYELLKTGLSLPDLTREPELELTMMVVMHLVGGLTRFIDN